jgi:hypothetical protein
VIGKQWTRRATADLARIAMQAGLYPDDAETALMLGARFLAHGFTGNEIDRMIVNHYQRAADAPRVGGQEYV